MNDPETIPGQLDGISSRLDASEVRVQAIERRQADMAGELRLNTEITSEIRDLMAAAKTGFKVLGGMGIALKWAGMVAAALVAIWTFVIAITHGGPKP